MSLHVETVVTGRWRENCYFVIGEQSRALVIDPGSDANRLVERIVEQKLRVLAILNTHAHYDHMGAVDPLRREFQIPFYLHSRDEKTMKQANLYRSLLGGRDPIVIPQIDFFLDRIPSPLRIDPFEVEVIPTPGHTPGGVCLRIENHLFTGDTLFQGAVGRTDLPGSSPQDLKTSLKKLSRLSPELQIYPGHGKTTSLSTEIRSNRAFLEATN